MKREDIIRKCQGLLAKSKSGNEKEMLAAAEMLFAWMAKYRVEMSEIEVAEDASEGLHNHHEPGKYNETWRRTCYKAAAKMFMCNYYFVPMGMKDIGVYHHLVGAKHNLGVAVEMGKYFEATINRLANEAARSQNIDRDAHTTRHQFIRSFRLACANRVYSRVLEYVANAKAGTLLDPETGKNLPAMLSLYDEADIRYNDWLLVNKIELTNHSSRDKELSAAGRSLGRQAGEKISFSTQVTSGSSAHALPRS